MPAPPLMTKAPVDVPVLLVVFEILRELVEIAPIDP